MAKRPARRVAYCTACACTMSYVGLVVGLEKHRRACRVRFGFRWRASSARTHLPRTRSSPRGVPRCGVRGAISRSQSECRIPSASRGYQSSTSSRPIAWIVIERSRRNQVRFFPYIYSNQCEPRLTVLSSAIISTLASESVEPVERGSHVRQRRDQSPDSGPVSAADGRARAARCAVISPPFLDLCFSSIKPIDTRVHDRKSRLRCSRCCRCPRSAAFDGMPIVLPSVANFLCALWLLNWLAHMLMASHLMAG